MTSHPLGAYGDFLSDAVALLQPAVSQAGSAFIASGAQQVLNMPGVKEEVAAQAQAQAAQTLAQKLIAEKDAALKSLAKNKHYVIAGGIALALGVGYLAFRKRR